MKAAQKFGLTALTLLTMLGNTACSRITLEEGAENDSANPSGAVQQALNGVTVPWVGEGPGPITLGQTENLQGANGNEVAGAVHVVVAHPTDANRLVIGAANGGIWTTQNALTDPPTWSPRTNTQPSQSIGSLDMDPANPNVLLAGFGAVSSFFRSSGALAGLIVSSNFGEDWSPVQVASTSNATPIGRSILSTAIRGNVMLIGDYNSQGTVGVIRSQDSGLNWDPVTLVGGSSFPTGRVYDLTGDPADPDRFYAAVVGTGILTSDDTGATWSVANGPTTCPVAGQTTCLDNLLFQSITNGGTLGANSNIELAVGANGRLYAIVIWSRQPVYIGFSDDNGTTWTAMDLPRLPATAAATITGASNDGNPIVITTAAPHGLNTLSAGALGNVRVRISGVQGNTNANGDFSISIPVVAGVPSPNTFTLASCYTFGGCPIIGNAAFAASPAASYSLFDSTSPRIDHTAGGQGDLHLSIAVDPVDEETVYVGGDRQNFSSLPFNGGFNQIGASDFSGTLWRGDASAGMASGTAPGTLPGPSGNIPSPQWEHLTHDLGAPGIPNGGTPNGSAPHADSRDIAFDANNNMIQVDDGGVYRRISPLDNTGDWWGLNGNLQVTELHSLVYDSANGRLFGGTQDVGNPQQASPANANPANTSWADFERGDGGDVAVDVASLPGLSIRYTSRERFVNPRRCIFNAAGQPSDNTGTAVAAGSAAQCSTLQLQLRCTPTCATSGAACTFTGATCPGPGCQCAAPDTCQNTCPNPSGGTFSIDASPVGQFPFLTKFALNPFDAANPARIVILAMNSAYESLNGGDTIFQLRNSSGVAVGGALDDARPTPVVAGHPLDPELLWVGGNSLMIRTAATGTLNNAAVQPGGRVVGIDVDPSSTAIAYMATTNRVFMTTMTGGDSQDITGDLYDSGQPVPAGQLWDIAFIPGNPARIFLGTSAGVFVSSPASLGYWNQVGGGPGADAIPNAMVSAFAYDPTTDTLYAGTRGRGAFRLSNASTMNLPPFAACQVPPVVIAADAMCMGTISVADINDGSGDPEGALQPLSLDATGPFPLGDVDVTLTATDGTNTETCTVTATVADLTAPDFEVPADIVTDRCVVHLELPTATDNCVDPDVTGTITSLAPPVAIQGTTTFSSVDIVLPPGDHSIDWTAMDAMNGTTKTQNVSIEHPYIHELVNGDVEYSITFNQKQAYVEVFVRQNGIQNISGNIVASEVNNGNGTYTYRRVVAASMHAVGDSLSARFYSYKAQSPGVFTPGPTQQIWLPTYYYGIGIDCLPTCHPFIKALPNGNLKFQITYPAQQSYVEAFIRRNGTQIAAGNIANNNAVVRNSDGTFTYTRVLAANQFQNGDQVTVRFYSYIQGQPPVFIPGPGNNGWSAAFTVGQQDNPNCLLPPPPGSCVVSALPRLAATASSSESSSLNATKAIDGNLGTRWSSQFSNPQWIYVDLGQNRHLGSVVLTWEAAASADYDIQVAADGTGGNGPWTTVYTDTHGNGGVDAITGLNAVARYVRMYSRARTTSYGNSLWEFEVNGDLNPSCTP